MADGVPAPNTAVETVRPRGRIGRVVLIAVLSVAVALCVALTVLIRTRAGQEAILDIVGERLSADVTVSEVHSAGPLSGATLAGIALSEPGRPPAFSADSIRVRYSIWSLLRGRFALTGLEMWGPRLIVERRQGESEANSGGSGASAASTGSCAKWRWARTRISSMWSRSP